MLPKIREEKLFTIIYADILIFANVAQNGKSWVPLGNIGKNKAPPALYCMI